MANNYEITINDKKLLKMWDELTDDDTMLKIHQALYKRINPYIPYRSGELANTADISAEGIYWTTDYWHYVYEGIVYGPNIPIHKGKRIVGWFSPPGQPKYPTGRPMRYWRKYHKKATDHWDDVALIEEREKITKDTEKILRARARALNK